MVSLIVLYKIKQKNLYYYINFKRCPDNFICYKNTAIRGEQNLNIVVFVADDISVCCLLGAHSFNRNKHKKINTFLSKKKSNFQIGYRSFNAVLLHTIYVNICFILLLFLNKAFGLIAIKKH